MDLQDDLPATIPGLQKELQEKALQLADLELMIEDYERERVRLLKELTILRERLLDLTEGEQIQKAKKV
jgi:hypothetical protein